MEKTENMTGNLVNTNIKVHSPKKAFAKFFFVTFIIVLIIGIGAMVVVTSMLDTSILDKKSSSGGVRIGLLIPAEGMFATDPEFKDSKRINVLLLGETKEKLSDTIMVASYDQETKDIDIISVPRDTYHEREGYTDPGTKKINAAYWGDPVNSAQAVHEVLQGIPINYYATINYEGVANIVDAIGGVDVDVPFDMNYEKHSENPPLIIHLKAGEQTLNGKDAVGFLRYRSGYRDGDYGRINAQQQFVESALKKSSGLNITKLAGSVIENVDSDITLRTILSLASDANEVSTDSVDMHTLPGNSGMYQGLSFFFGDYDQIEEMLRAIYSGTDFESTTSAITGPEDLRQWSADGNDFDDDDGYSDGDDENDGYSDDY